MPTRCTPTRPTTGSAATSSPDDNPAVDDVLPEGVTEPDDKAQEPDGGQDEESDTTASSDDGPSAGQEAEDGSPEPPA